MDEFDLAGMGAPERGVSAWPEPARRALGCGAGCALVVLLEFLIVWLVITVMLNARPPEGLVARTDLPSRAVVGKKVPLRLSVRNQGDRAFTVRGITARSETLRRFKLENASPPPITGKTVLFGTETWSYNQVIEPAKSWSVTLDAVPREAGTLHGVMEIQAGSGITTAAFTVEAEAAEPSPVKPRREKAPTGSSRP